jgi:hypothetical protein
MLMLLLLLLLRRLQPRRLTQLFHRPRDLPSAGR